MTTPAHVARMNQHRLYLLALSADDITVVVEGTAEITVARLAPVLYVRQSVVLRQTLVAVPAQHVALTRTLARDLVAAFIVDRAFRVARTRCKH